MITQLFIIGVPVFAAWYTKKDFKETFSIKAPKPVWVLGALLVEMGGYLLVLLLSVLLERLFPQDIEAVSETMEMMISGAGFVPALLVIALSPAICEEALFRGYFFSASKKRLRPLAAIVLGAAVFGIYHLSFVKFFTTGLLGILFCYVVYRTGSIFLTSMMHFINNAVAVLVMFYPSQMERILPFLFQKSLSVVEVIVLLLTGVVILFAGIFLLQRDKKTNY